MAEILHKLLINGQAEEVFNAISTQSGLRSWWTRDCVTDEFEGGQIDFYFDKRAIHVKMIIASIETHKRIRWKCINGMDEWLDTNISYDIAPHDKGIMLTFRHSDWINTYGFLGTAILTGEDI